MGGGGKAEGLVCGRGGRAEGLVCGKGEGAWRQVCQGGWGEREHGMVFGQGVCVGGGGMGQRPFYLLICVPVCYCVRINNITFIHNS